MINSHAIASRGARVGRRPPPPSQKYKKYFWAILGAFLLHFSHFGGLFTMWGPFRYFLLHGGGLFLGLPPSPLPKFLWVPMIARRVREHAPRNFFLCDRNLVSSGHVLLRFCLKNDKNNDKL